MSRAILAVTGLLLSLGSLFQVSSQQPAVISPNAAVPLLVKFSGALTDESGKPLTGVVGVTFLFYKDSQGGAPLWLETQSVQADKTGHYTVALGSTTSQGLPASVFGSGEARWLAVQAQGREEQPRVLLMSVPYAIKALDAETIGGLPPSAFVLAAPTVVNSVTVSGTSPLASAPPPASSNVTTTGGTANAIPMFTTATDIQNSILTQIGTTAVNVAGKLTLSANGTATTTAGKNSRPEAFVASAFNSGSAAAVQQTFQLQAEPAGNNTVTPSGTLNLLYGSGSTTPAETGLKINNKGLITFATGQTFPGSGGTVKSVGLTAPTSDFTVGGSPVTNTGTLNFAWNVAPASADTANAIVKRDTSGSFSATSENLSGGFQINSTFDTPVFVSTSSTLQNSAGIFSQAIGYGVIGASQATSGSAYGVYGGTLSSAGIGVFGQLGTLGSTGTDLAATGAGSGVWGDGGTSGVGVIGTADANFAGYFVSNTPTLYSMWVQNTSTGTPFVAGSGPDLGSVAKHYCDIDNSGNLNCTGSKNAVVPIDSGKRIVAMSAIEAPQNWFEDFGEAQLSNGAAVVQLDSNYIQTVNTDTKYQVFLTPYGDCKGLYVTNRTANSFEVHELGGGAASLSFGYRVTALRKNYENVRFADHTHELDGMKPRLVRGKASAAPRHPGDKLWPTPANAAQLTTPRPESAR